MNAAVTSIDEHFPSAALEEDEYDRGQEPYVFPWPEGRHDCAMDDTREANASGINIHGKRYTTVATRVEIFRRHFGVFGRLRIIGEVEMSGVISMTAAVELRAKDGWEVVAEGRAEEVRSNTGINSTSAREVCETSAYGRALANFGLGGSEFASANEVEQAKKQQDKPKTMVEHGTFKDNSGKPDTSGVDPAVALRHAENFKTFLAINDAKAIYETHDALNKNDPDHETGGLYQAVWSKLAAGERATINKIIRERPKT